jgi:hypothetical protein
MMHYEVMVNNHGVSLFIFTSKGMHCISDPFEKRQYITDLSNMWKSARGIFYASHVRSEVQMTQLEFVCFTNNHETKNSRYIHCCNGTVWRMLAYYFRFQNQLKNVNWCEVTLPKHKLDICEPRTVSKKRKRKEVDGVLSSKSPHEMLSEAKRVCSIECTVQPRRITF